MKHPAENENELWKKYIRGELSPELTQRIEGLLERDEAAFASYLDALTSLEEELPSLRNDGEFTSGVLQSLPEQDHQRANVTRIAPDAKRQWINYGIAAAATILLLSGGIFDRITSGAGAAVKITDSERSISSKWMERTDTWMNDLMKEGKDRQ